MSDIPHPQDQPKEGGRKLSTADLANAAKDRPAATRGFDAEASEAGAGPLFPAEDAGGFRTRWTAIQTSFVDQPRQSVEAADALVAEAIKRLAEMFAQERSDLEGQWDRGDRVSTEDLRQAPRRYRSFFARLLAV
jgi:hypothetical protein